MFWLLIGRWSHTLVLYGLLMWWMVKFSYLCARMRFESV